MLPTLRLPYDISPDLSRSSGLRYRQTAFLRYPQRVRWAIVVLFLMVAVGVQAQSARDSLTTELQAIADSAALPGFSVAVVSKDTVLYAEGFGYADVAKQVPFTRHTVLNIGSITKTLIGVAVLKLVEEGRMSLDDDINAHLPFRVVHPSFPNRTITVRQLATHTSSLTDGEEDLLIERSYLFQDSVNFEEAELPEDYYEYFQIYRKNRPMPMGAFLEAVYTPTGHLYSADNFLPAPPGTQYHYTNLGATLLAYIVEHLSGQSFADYTAEQVLAPLKMHRSYWRLADVPADQLITHYLSNGLAIPAYELITYPDGGLFTCASDFGLYLRDMIRGLKGEGQLLRQASYTTLMSNQLTPEHFPEGDFDSAKGILWSVNRDGDNVSMNGADPGIVTYTLFTTQGDVGIVFFTNTSFYGNDALEPDFRRVRAALFRRVKALLRE